MFTIEQKRFLIELQTSKKHKRALCNISNDGDSFCCLGVYAECCCIENETSDHGRVNYKFETETSSIGFSDYKKFNLYTIDGELFSVCLSIGNTQLHSLVGLNDYTHLEHKEMAKFIYLYKENVFTNFERPKEEIKICFNSDSEFVSFLDEKISATSYCGDLEKWKKELAY